MPLPTNLRLVILLLTSSVAACSSSRSISLTPATVSAGEVDQLFTVRGLEPTDYLVVDDGELRLAPDTHVELASTETPIEQASGAQLSIRLTAHLDPGSYDLVIQSSAGRTVAHNALTALAAPAMDASQDVSQVDGATSGAPLDAAAEDSPVDAISDGTLQDADATDGMIAECRFNPADCNGGIGGFCALDSECDTGFCCNSNSNCGTRGMCTFQCSDDSDCPTFMACEHDLCFLKIKLG